MTPAANLNFWLSWQKRRQQVGSTHKYSRVLSTIGTFDIGKPPDVCLAKSFLDSWALRPIMHGLDLVMCLDDIVSLHDGYGRNLLLFDEITLNHSVGIITTSEGFYPWLDENIENDCPRYWLPLKPSIEDMVLTPHPKKQPKTAVYTGGIITPQMRRSTFHEYDYRDLSSIFKEILDAGWEVHIYCPYFTTKDTARYYEKMGCTTHPFTPMSQLPAEMSRYEVGLQGFGEPYHPYAALCTPNKTWEYLAAGIPTLGIGFTGISSTIYEGKWGTARKPGEPMADALERAAAIEVTVDLQLSQALEEHSSSLREWLGTLDYGNPERTHEHPGFTFNGNHYDRAEWNSTIHADPRFTMGVDEVGTA